MSYSLRIDGADKAIAALDGFSPRRIRAVVATALTRTVRDLEGEWVGEIFSSIDRPTGFTTRAVSVKRATAEQLRAEVFIRDQPARADAPSPLEWLGPQEFGGDRFVKKFERALMAQGSMPPGHKVVPGKYAELDAYGNISRSQITQVIAQLGTQFSPGYQRTISKSLTRRIASAKRHGREYIAFTKRGRGQPLPGVYQRDGRELHAVFLYLRTVTYRKRTDFEQISQAQGPALLEGHIQRAIGEHIQRLTAGRDEIVNLARSRASA